MKETINYEDFAKVDLQTGTVEEAERVENSDKLLRLIVNIGTEKRQIIAGIGKKYAPDDIAGKQIVIVANLLPRTLMGLESQGMILAAGEEAGPVILSPESRVEDGVNIK